MKILKTNQNKPERVLRFILAVLLIPTPFIFEATAYTYVLCAVGGILLFNALVGVCVIYGIFGVNTCENS